ncbi:VCBS repeat-containing protein [Sulfitobacter sp. HNIBRBA3233]|uniref:FG-GAP repeat domain-containing protein n=1 Tax=Sulfitobacter marinivivus TaxID=3158558 RepID=UPI0032DE6BCA
MPAGPRRPAQHPQRRSARRGGLALCVVLALPAPAAALAQGWQTAALEAAEYGAPTERYPHGVLGDDTEYGSLTLHYGSARLTITLPQTRVFEDVAPRLADVDGDGRREAVVVESDQSLGARLAIYNGGGLLAATPFIGQRFRWLAPVAIADLDGDGRIELAYIDRPHLAKTLRVWRMENGTLREIATRTGLTNHRIGERDIAGGLRLCADRPEMVLATADWSRLVAVRFDGASAEVRDIGPQTGRASFARAMGC